MPKGTPEEIKQEIKDQVDKLHNHEYETDTEIKEIKERVGVTSDELSPDALERLASQGDEMVKRIDEISEQMKEAEADTLLTDDEEEPLKDVHLGTIMSEIRDATHHGMIGPTLTALNVDHKAIRSDGVMLPREIAKLFDGSRRKTTGYLEEGQLSMGGATVAEQFIPTLLSLPLLDPIVRSRAYVIRGTSNVARVPRINETTRAENVHGGISGSWTAEGGSISLSNPAFGQAVLIAKKLALLTYASNELLEDNAVGLNDVLMRLFSESLNWFEDKAFINGSGVAEPLGVRNAPCLQASTATTASVFYVQDACILLSELMPGSERTACWLMHPTMRRELPQMVSVGGTGGENIWYRNALTIKEAPDPWTLLGMPIFWTEHCAARGTDADVILTDLSYYLLLERQAIRAAVSTDARFANDETGYRLTLRSDGQPWPSSNLTLADGSATVSPFVANNHT